MKTLRGFLSGVLAAATALASAGCATSSRLQPATAEPTELNFRWDNGLEVWADGKRVAESPQWDGLRDYVHCVKEADEHAANAAGSGGTVPVFSWLGFSFGALSFGGIAGAVADRDHALEWLGAGLGSAVIGLIFAFSAVGVRARADGNAVDAVNYYNDQVGYRGRGCDDRPSSLASPRSQ